MIRNHKILLSRQLKNVKNINQIIKTTTEKENKTEKIFINNRKKVIVEDTRKRKRNEKSEYKKLP